MDNALSSSYNITTKEIENRIYTIRVMQVMIDSHLAEMYSVEIRVLNQAVKRNSDRFPETYMFQTKRMSGSFKITICDLRKK